MSNCEGDEIGKKKIFKLDSLYDVLVEAEKIMRNEDVEYGLRPFNFANNNDKR